MSKPRPVCVHCGAQYGRRNTKTETVRWAYGEQPPPYRGNGVIVREKMHREAKPDLVMPTGSVVEGHWQAARAPLDPIDRTGVLYREIWDGESWFGGYEPFCTLRCALGFARRMYARTAPR
jgi:hypothetical protein